MNTERRNGVYLRVDYIAPRKRKAKPWDCAADTLEEAVSKAKNWFKEHGGKFFNPRICSCSLYDVESDGKIITMQSVAIFAPQTPIDITLLN